MGRLRFNDVKKELISPQVAMVLGSWDLERESGEIGGLYTLLLRKVGDGEEWKIVRYHSSSRPCLLR